MTKPLAVLFVDDGPWDCFIRLSAFIRRGGIRTVRLTNTQPRRVLAAFGLVYDHTICTDVPGWESELERVMSRHTLTDVQCTETSAAFAYVVAGAMNSPHAGRWAARAATVDKFDLARTLRNADVRVPDTIEAAAAPPGVAVARLGLPLVCKPRVGNGGSGVHIVSAVAGVERIAAAEPTAQRFYERHIVGESLSFGALVTEDGIAAAACYAFAGRMSPTGPPVAVESRDVPQFDKVAADIVAATGLRGLLNFQAILDADGALWVHDVNPRAWGSLVATVSMGVDVGTAYVRWLKGLSVPFGHSRAGIGPVPIFPGAAVTAAPGSPTARDFAAWLWKERRTCGIGFSLVEATRHRTALNPRWRARELASAATTSPPPDERGLTTAP